MIEIYSKVPTVVLVPRKAKIKFVYIIFTLLGIALVSGIFFLVRSLVLGDTEKEVEATRFIYGFFDDFSDIENSKSRWDFSNSKNGEAHLLNGENLELKKGGAAKWPSRISGDFEVSIKLTPVDMTVLKSSSSFSFSDYFGIELSKLESGDYMFSAFEVVDDIQKEIGSKIVPFGNSYLLKIVRLGGIVNFYIDDMSFALSNAEPAILGSVLLQTHGEESSHIRIFFDDFYLRFNKSL